MEQLEDRTTPSVLDLTPMLWTNKFDYAPRETALINGSGFHFGERVELQVLHTDGTANTGAGHEVWYVTDGVTTPCYVDAQGTYHLPDLDATVNGAFQTTWYVNPDDSLGSTFVLTATGLENGSLATTTFTDAGSNPAVDLRHYENLTEAWRNGQANTNQAAYLEGDVVPHWLRATNLTIGTTYGVRINLDYYQFSSDSGGFLYLDTYNESITGVPPNPGTLTADSTFSFADPLYGNQGLTFYVVNADVVSVSYTTGLLTRYADVTFTALDETANLYWGARLALPNEVQTLANLVPGSNGASGFTGGNLAIKIEGIGATGPTWITPSNQVSLMPGTIFEGSISGYKWNDLDGDGVKDSGEPGLAGWQISLYEDNVNDANPGVFDSDDVLVTLPATGINPVITSDGTTDVNADGTINAADLGYYEFAHVLRGTYYVVETPETGWTQTYPTSPNYHTVSINETTPTRTNVNFGNWVPPMPGIHIEKVTNGDDGLYIPVGAPIIWTYTVTNTGNVALSGISVTDDQGVVPVYQSGDSNTDGILDLNETWRYEATGVAVAGAYSNIGTVVGTSPTGPQVIDKDPGSYFGAAPALTLEKTGVFDAGADGYAQPGELITYTYQVTNTGNVALNDVTVTDSLPGLSAITPAEVDGLAPNAVATFMATYAVSQADIDAGSVYNAATATGKPPVGPNVTGGDDNTETLPQHPAIQLVKSGTWVDANANGYADVGEFINYEFKVTNAGNISLTGVTVTDTRAGVTVAPTLAPDGVHNIGDTDRDNKLDLSETWLYTGTYAVTQANIDAGSVYNLATADSNESEEDTDAETVILPLKPAIRLVKSADPTTVPETGGNVVFNYVLTNTSLEGVNDPLTVTELRDDRGTAYTGDDFYLVQGGVLQPGVTLTKWLSDADNRLEKYEIWIYSTLLVVPPGNASGGLYLNTAYVIAHDDEGTEANDNDIAQVEYWNTPPEIQVVKTADPVSLLEGTPGQEVTFSYEVTNHSPAGVYDPMRVTELVDNHGTLLDFSDDVYLVSNGVLQPGVTLTRSGTDNGDDWLDVGEVWTYTVTLPMPVRNAGRDYINLVGVVGRDDENFPAWDWSGAEVSYLDVAPSILVEKTRTAPAEVPEGTSEVTWMVTITNTSTAITDPVEIQSLTDSVFDDLLPEALNAFRIQTQDPAAQVIVLQPGAEFQFSFTRWVTGSADQRFTNVVTVFGRDDERNDTSGEAEAAFTFVAVPPPYVPPEIPVPTVMAPDPAPFLLPTGTYTGPMAMPMINAVFNAWRGPTTFVPAMNSVWWSLLEGGSEEAVGILSGFVYRDENANGRRDPSEEGVFGVPTFLTGISFRSGGVARVAFTDRAGFYRFSDLEPGRYVIHGNQPEAYLAGEDMVGFVDGTQTGYLGGNKTIGGIFLPPGGLGWDYNFGQHLPATLEGVVVEDGIESVFLEGVVVSLTGKDYRGMLVRETVLTDPDGTYRFERLRPGTYQISVGNAPKMLTHRATVGSLGGWHEGRSEVVSIEVADGAFGGQYNFGQVAPAHLSGTVRLAGAKTPTGVSGVLVTLTGSDDEGQSVKRTVPTSKDGRYEFVDLLPGRYSVSANLKTGEALPGTILGRKPGGIIGAAGKTEKVIIPASAEVTGLTVSEIGLAADDLATDFNFVGTPAGEAGSK